MSLNVSRRSDFDSAALQVFLKSGWMLALDAQRFLVGWGEWSQSKEPSTEPGQCSLFAPDFYLEASEPWRSTHSWDLVDRHRFVSLVLAGVAHNVNANDQGFQWLEPTESEFAEGPWREIRKGFSDRGLQKAVPVVFSRARTAISIAAVLKRLVAPVPRAEHLRAYGFWDSGLGMIGATPELLFSARPESGVVETMALAGTRGKDEDRAAIQLLADAKERYEHQLVVDDLKARLSAIGDVSIGPTQVLELPALYHLHTRVQARPRRAPSFMEMVRVLHPTPALGVSPRAAGFAEMRRWDDPSARLRFGAPFGAVWPEGMNCVVAIRNIQWAGDEVRLGSGCGVVPESQVEREWQELALKRSSVKRLLGL